MSAAKKAKVEEVQERASIEHTVWTLNAALHMIDEVLCDQYGDEAREHNARAAEALVRCAIADIEKMR